VVFILLVSARCTLLANSRLNLKHVALYAAVAEYNLLVTNAELLRFETA